MNNLLELSKAIDSQNGDSTLKALGTVADIIGKKGTVMPDAFGLARAEGGLGIWLNDGEGTVRKLWASRNLAGLIRDKTVSLKNLPSMVVYSRTTESGTAYTVGLPHQETPLMAKQLAVKVSEGKAYTAGLPADFNPADWID